MARVRVVGRRTSHERCVICHAALREPPVTCAGCKAVMHADCRAGIGRCPTIGCVHSGRFEALAPIVVTPDEARAGRARRRGPPLSARLGPYSRLLLSTAVSALLFAGCAAVILWPVVTRELIGEPHDSFLERLATTCVVWALAGIGVFFSATWLFKVPAVFREVRQLLNETQPVLMRVTIVTTGVGSDERTRAVLAGGGHDLELDLGGLLPPGWLKKLPSGTRCYVYGLPPPGPYLIETPDGRLALVHPDD